MQVDQGNAFPDTKSESGSVFPYSSNSVQEALQDQLLKVTEVVGAINTAITEQVPNGRQTNVREALIWMLRRDWQSRHSLGQPEDKQLYTDVSKYIVTIAKQTHSRTETAKERALFILDQVRAVINVDTMPADLGKEVELEPAAPDDSKSEIGFKVDHIIESVYSDFYKKVTKELIGNSKALEPYRDADNKERKLLLFTDVNEDIKTDKVLDTVQNVVLFVKNMREYLPLLFSADQAAKVFPGFFSIKGNDALFLQAVQAIVRGRIDVDVLVRLAEALYNQKLDVAQLNRYVSVADERLQLTNKIRTLEEELKSERENSAMRSVIHAALERFASENKANEQLIFEVLRNDSMLYDRLRDLYKIYQFARSRNLPPDDLWKILDDYRTLDAKFKLLENKNNVNQTLEALLKLLDDNLLQPAPTLKLLQQLISDLGPSGIQSAAETIRKLTRRNSDLSDSFRKTLVAMAAVLQVMQDVSKRYASQVLVYIQNLSNQMYQVINSWGLDPNSNPLAMFVRDLTTRFVTSNYSVEVKTNQIGTLELTFNGQGLDLSTDGVFLHTVSLLKWLDRFLVDPKRPSDPEMASLWNRASAGLDDWQQAVIDTFAKTDVTGPAQPVATITNGIYNASRNVGTVMEDSLRKVNAVAVDSLDRFSKDLKTQEDRLNRRVEYLLTNPALGQYVLTVNGQDVKEEQKKRDLFKAFIDATRVALLDNKKDDANSVEVMAEINKLANEMDKLKLESSVKDSEYKKLDSEHKTLTAEYKKTEKAKQDAEKKISDAQAELIAYTANTPVTLDPDLVKTVKALLVFYKARWTELTDVATAVGNLARTYNVPLAANDPLPVQTKAILKFFSEKADNWQKASDKLRGLSQSVLFRGGYKTTTDLEADVSAVLTEFLRTLDDWEKTEAIVFKYANDAKVNMNANSRLELNAKKLLDAYEKYRQDFDTLTKEEDNWWTNLELVRYPPNHNLTDEDKVERKATSVLLSNVSGTLDILAKRRSVVVNWVKTLADLVDENDSLTVKNLIAQSKGKGSSAKSASAAAASQPSTSLNPYYRVQFNGEVDTLTGNEIFPVFLPSTPFMRLWLFAREFAGAASNQLGNILEPLAPGLEINDERTLFILRTYQGAASDKKNPDLPTGANRADLAKQQLADDEDKQNLKETAEERRKLQEKVALQYIAQLDKYRDLDEYEVKVRQYFKEMATNALVHCQEILQRTDLPDFRKITLAELINSSNLSSGFARMCGLYLLVKQGTVPGMISTQSSAANRVAEFDQHARNLPRMYRRRGKYVWEVVRIPSVSDSSFNNSKRLRL